MPLFNPPAAAGGSGTVTSVGLSASGLLHTVSGSPVTTSGVLALTLKTQVAGSLLCGPISGADAAPTMRALDPLDVPALDAAKITSGTFGAARIGSVNPSVLTGTGTVPLAALTGLTTSQLSGSAGLVAGQIASVNPATLTGSGTVPLAGLTGITTSQLAASAGILGSQLDSAAAIASGQIASLATSKLTGTIAASQLAVSAPTSGQLGGLTTSNLSATAGILGSQLDAAAGITSGQIASVAASTLTGSIADARLSANVPLLNASNVFTTAGSSASSGTPLLVSIAPTVTQSGTAGYTALDVNVTQSSTGSGLKRLLDLRVAGVTKCWVDSTGALTLQSTLAMISGATFKVGNTLLVNSANSTSFTMGGQSTTATGIFAFVSANNASNGMNAASGSQSWMSVAAAVTQSGTAGYTALLVNSTETSVGSGTKLLQDWQTGGTSKASIDDTGALAFSPATTTSAPSNGAGGALPANATGFATVTINGTARQICYW